MRDYFSGFKAGKIVYLLPAHLILWYFTKNNRNLLKHADNTMRQAKRGLNRTLTKIEFPKDFCRRDEFSGFMSRIELENAKN